MCTDSWLRPPGTDGGVRQERPSIIVEAERSTTEDRDTFRRTPTTETGIDGSPNPNTDTVGGGGGQAQGSYDEGRSPNSESCHSREVASSALHAKADQTIGPHRLFGTDEILAINSTPPSAWSGTGAIEHLKLRISLKSVSPHLANTTLNNDHRNASAPMRRPSCARLQS